MTVDAPSAHKATSKTAAKVDEIAEALQVFHDDGELIEIRGFIDSKWLKNASGYFTDPRKAAEAFVQFATTRKDTLSNANSQWYFTLNNINPACYNRKQHDAVKENAKHTTSDGDILRYKWLFIDFDPARPSDTSSSDDELNAAFSKLNKVYDYMTSVGFSEPITACSGNGYHLHYRIDLEATEGSRTLIKNCLQSLDEKFSDDIVKIDRANCNPARICKLYGTKAQKGANTSERPHRESHIMSKPETIVINPRELLVKLAGEPERERAAKSKPKQTYTPSNGEKFNLVDFMHRNGIGYKELRASGRDGSTIYSLDTCPFDSSHTNGDAKIFAYPDGAISFTCHHNSCIGKKWQDVRRLYDPTAYGRKCDYYDEGWHRHNKRDDSDNIIVFSGDLLADLGAYTISSLTEEERKPPEFLVDNLVPVGLTFLSGAPKIRKSFMALQIAAAVATGSEFLGFKTKRCDVVYFDLEGSKSRAATRSERMSQQVPDNVFLIHKTDFKLADGLVDTIQALHKQHPSIRLYIIDTYSRARGAVKSIGANAYDADVAFLEPLQRMATDENIAILCIHHDKKGAGMMQDSFERLSGTMGISGSADCVLNLVADGKRFEGTAKFEYSPRDAKGGEINLIFNDCSCEWQKDIFEQSNIIGNPIIAYCVDNAPEKNKEGVFISYEDVYRGSYKVASSKPGDEIMRAIKNNRAQIYSEYGVGVQLGVQSHGRRGVRLFRVM